MKIYVEGKTYEDYNDYMKKQREILNETKKTLLEILISKIFKNGKKT